MSLWVMSQDKHEFGKFNNFSLEKNIAGKWAIMGHNGLQVSNNIVDNKIIISVIELGVYSSEKRAMEVLRCISENSIVDVYEMPEN